MMAIGLVHYLVVSVLVLSLGITTMVLKRNAIGILMGTELVMSAAMINFVAFNAYTPVGGATPMGPRLDGQMMTLFILVLAAAEAAVAVAVFINLHRTTGSVDVEEVEVEGPR